MNVIAMDTYVDFQIKKTITKFQSQDNPSQWRYLLYTTTRKSHGLFRIVPNVTALSLVQWIK